MKHSDKQKLGVGTCAYQFQYLAMRVFHEGYNRSASHFQKSRSRSRSVSRSGQRLRSPPIFQIKWLAFIELGRKIRTTSKHLRDKSWWQIKMKSVKWGHRHLPAPSRKHSWLFTSCKRGWGVKFGWDMNHAIWGVILDRHIFWQV